MRLLTGICIVAVCVVLLPWCGITPALATSSDEVWVVPITDLSGGTCELPNGDGGFVQVAIIHRAQTEALGVGYAAPAPPCSDWLHLGDLNNFLAVIGNSQNGIAVGYGTCFPSGEVIHVQTISYFGSLTTCCDYPVVDVERSDCEGMVEPAVGGVSVVGAISGVCECYPGAPPAPCTVSPTSIDFGGVIVGNSRDRSFTITNNSGESLTGDVTESCAHYSVESGGSYNLSPGQSQTVTVRFAPESEGTHTCTIDLGNAMCRSVFCTGVGVPPCAVSPTSIDFGRVAVGGSLDMDFTITNTGDDALVGSVSEACDHYRIESGGSYNLATGESQTVTVRFAPESTGTHTCSIDTGSPLCGDVFCTGVGDGISVAGGEVWAVPITDLTGGTCELPNGSGGVVQVAIIHRGHDGTLAVGYVAPAPPCSGWLHLGDANNFDVAFGNSQDGIAVGYGTCVPPGEVIHVQTITYFGSPATCCDYPILDVEHSTCETVVEPAIGGVSLIGAVAGVCECDPSGPLPVTTGLDVKPGACPNPFNTRAFDFDPGANPRRGGVLPVAVLGSESFDVSDIDVTTLRLEGVEPVTTGQGPRLEDVATALGEVSDCECTDDGPDGFVDLNVKFLAQAIKASIPMGEPGEEQVLTLTGELLDGTPFEATDCIVFVGPADASARADSEAPIMNTAFPNPFNPVTRISYVLPKTAVVGLSIYDVRGGLVETLVAGTKPAGEHVAEWNATGQPSGIYFYRLEVGNYTETRKMVLVK